MKDNRVKLAILITLVVAIAIVILLLLRGCQEEEKTVAGGAFTASMDIVDLHTPLGVTADQDGQIYISNTGASEVRVYSPEGEMLYKIDSGEDEKGEAFQYWSPYGIAYDDARGKLYVADYTVRVVDKEGNYFYSLTPPAEAITEDESVSTLRPNQVALTSDRVYVTSRDGIYVFDAEDGTFITHWGSRGPGVGQYDFPNGIAVDEETGNVFVVDVNNWRVVSLTSDGQVRWILGRQEDGAVKSPFRLPRSVAVGPDGLVYITDAPDRIVVLDQDGNLVSVEGERGTAEAQLNFPEGIYITDNNRLLVADRENNRVQVWDLAAEPNTADFTEVEKFKEALRNYQ